MPSITSPRTDLDSSGRRPLSARSRAIAILLTAVLGLAAVAGTALLLGRSVGGHDTVRRVNGFLADLRDQNYMAAYDRLCPEHAVVETREVFAAHFRAAQAAGAGVASYSIKPQRTMDSSAFSAAEGTVTLADGTMHQVVFSLSPADQPMCIDTYDGI